MSKPPMMPVLAEEQPGPPLYETFQLIFKATNVPQSFPAFQIPPGGSVTLYPTTNTGVNANASQVASRASELGTSAARIIPAGADVAISIAVDNLGNIWTMGTANDGMLAVVQAPQIG